MKSGLRRLLNQTGPPVPLAGGARARGMFFDLGAGKQSRETQMRTYGQSGTVFSIVGLLAQAAATPKWHLYKKQPVDGRRRYSTGDLGSDQRVEVVSHAALSLWNKPNDFHSGFEFREGSNQHEELTGETFWVLNREGTTFPTSIWYVRPDRLEPVPDPQDFLVGWIYTGPNGEQIPLKADEVILEKLPDPLDPFRGAGPVASIMPNLQQQRYATEYQRNLFLNGADPGGIISVPSKLTDTQFDELVERWRETHQGVARAGRVGVLEGQDVTWIPGGQTNKDLEYGNLRLANRDEIREAWRMHKAMLGTVEDVNRANAQTAEEVFVAWQTIPRLERRQDTLNSKLLPMFGQGQEDIYEFGYEDPSPVNQEAANGELLVKSQAALALVQAGYDQGDVLEAVGLPDMDVAGIPGTATGAQQDSEDIVGLGNRVQRERITMKRDTSAKVAEQLCRDYPPEWCTWVYHAAWMGPMEVGLGSIDTTGIEDDFGRTQDDIDRFKKKIQKKNGHHPKPAILVKTPDAKKLFIVDGHGRIAAYDELGLPAWAYVGVTDTNHGDWEVMHDHQDVAEDDQDGAAANSLRRAADDHTGVAELLRRLLNDGYVPVEIAGRP